MKVDVDHAADDPLQVPFGKNLCMGVGEIVLERTLSELLDFFQIGADQRQLANDEIGFDHPEAPNPSTVRRT